MSPHTGSMLLAGGANLLLAAAWMFGALIGSNGMDGRRGGVFLAGMALALALLWAGSLVLARSLTAWGLVRDWHVAVCVVLAALIAVAAWVALAFAATVVMAIVASR